MIEATAKQLAEELNKRGVDASSFLSDGFEAARAVGEDAASELEVLNLLAHFANQLANRGIALWTPFHFGVAPIARLTTNDPLHFATLLSDLWLLIDAMSGRSLSSDLALQHGVATAARADNASEALSLLLRTSARLASRGLDPKEVLRRAPSIARSKDAAAIAATLDAVESCLIALHENGVEPCYPILAGIAAIAETTQEDPYVLVDALRDFASALASMTLAGISPYAVAEHGVTAAFYAAGRASWLLSEILPLAGAIASHGNDPLETLARGVPAIANLEEGLALAVLLVVETAAEEGIDPAPVLHSFVPLLHQSDPDTAARLTSAACALLAVMAARKMRPLLAFDEGFARLEGRPLPLVERALRIARAIAESGSDPGPAITYGLVPTIARFEAEPPLLDAILDAAEKEALDGIDPWALLEWGTAAIASAGGDEAERLDLLLRLDALVRALSELGADVRAVLLYTIHQPARSLGQDRSLVIGLIDRTAGAIAALTRSGIDPRGTMVLGIPRAVEQAPQALEHAFRLIDALASRRIDPAPFLANALPVLATLPNLELALDRLLAAIDARPKNAGSLAEAIGAIRAREPFVMIHALEAIARLSARDLDPSPVFAAMLPELEGADEATFIRLIEVIERVMGEVGQVEDRVGLSYVARAARGRPEALAELLASWRRFAGVPLLEWGALAAEIVSDGDPQLFDLALERFVRATRDRAEPSRLEVVFRASLSSIAELSHREIDTFSALLDALLQLSASEGAPLEHLLEHALPIARQSAGRRADAYRDALEELTRLRSSGAIERVEREVWHAVGRLHSIVERAPEAWRELIVPTIRAQGAGSAAALAGYALLARWIDGDAIALLRTVATQEGVRAPELVQGFLLEALTVGAIRSLGEEREQILAFLRDVPIAHPEYYRRYAAIAGDDGKSASEKRAEIESLQAGVSALVSAIVKGEISEGLASDPLFADALFYVFPPAYTVHRQSYAWLVRAFADHPEHTVSHPQLEETRIELAAGGYFVKEPIELAPWRTLLDAVISVHASEGDAPELLELGGALLDAWLEGRIGQAEPKAELLRRIYRRHRLTGHHLPEELEDAACLLAHREFLADAAKEIIQDALRAVRTADPERYAERVQAKVMRRARVGTGLVRAVWRTVAAHREGTIDAETATERLVRQLKGFDLSSEQVRLRLLATDREDLEELLERLERDVPKIELGEEHLRVLGDLAGSELAAMKRELDGKLEYRRTEGGRSIPIRFEVTKRKVHAPIGYCEGVCTAPDQQLWDDPRFLQTILWGPDDRARGGVHLLVIEVDGDGWLSLPGINPSLSLLSEIGAEALLDAIFAFARQVAEKWGLKGVLVPTHYGIATNRGPIRELLDARGYPQRQLPRIQFSHRPYAYSFDRAFVIA